MATDDTEKTHSQVVRIVSDVGLLLVFLLLSLLAGRAGLASLFSRYAALSNQLPAADLAVSLSRNDPDAHLIRGALLEAAGAFLCANPLAIWKYPYTSGAARQRISRA